MTNTELPFVAKGVLSVQDALKCKEAGVRAIFISHHHGRIPYGIPPLMVLPEIKKALASQLQDFKIPRRIKFVEQFELTRTGKLKRS